MKATKKEYAEFIDKTYGKDDAFDEMWGKSQPKKSKPKIEVAVPEFTECWLPRTNDTKRTMSNHLARSSLFSPVARGRKRLLRDEILVSRCDAVIMFSGEQLDETQADLWMYLMHLASKKPLGAMLEVNRAKVLKAIGRAGGKAQYDWLFRSMDALSFAMLTIQTYKDGGKTKKLEITRVIHLINGFDTNHKTGDYQFYVDSRWAEVYSNEYALIDWNLRNQISQGQDIAKSIQRLVATSSNKQQFYDLDWLQKKLNLTSPIRKFKLYVMSAVTELIRVGIIVDGKFRLNAMDVEQLVLSKP